MGHSNASLENGITSRVGAADHTRAEGVEATEPTITISAMVRVGPWTVETVQHGPWRRCDRCNARHREVWTCTVDADAAELATTLRGQQTWRIGSTCGPTLMLVSEAVWDSQTKALGKVLHLLVRARRAIAVAAARNHEYWALSLIVERTELLQRRELTPHLTRWLSSHVTQLWNAVRPRE